MPRARVRNVAPTRWDLGNLGGLLYVLALCQGWAPSPADLSAKLALAVARWWPA